MRLTVVLRGLLLPPLVIALQANARPASAQSVLGRVGPFAALQGPGAVTQPNDKLDRKYRTVINGKQRDELCRGLWEIYSKLRAQKEAATIQFVLGQDEAVVAGVQATTLGMGQGFIQRYYSSRVRCRSVRAGEAGADRVRGPALG